jgi:hypothetical protein
MVMMLPREIIREIFTFIPYNKLIQNISLINYCCYDIILGNDSAQFWKEICKHQSIDFNIDTLAVEAFVTKYQPPNIRLKFEKNKSNIITSLDLIEPFVTTLQMDRKLYTIGINLYYKSKQRYVFPIVERLGTVISLTDLKTFFGTDVSRIKQLEITESDLSDASLDIQLNSLEKVTFFKCGIIERYILKQNLNTLQSIKFNSLSIGSNLECIDLLAPTISTLSLQFTDNIMLKQISFSQLRNVTIDGNGEQIEQFFSVTHPLLTKVNVNMVGTDVNLVGISLAQQYAIRYVNCRLSTNLMNALLNVVNHKLVTRFKWRVVGQQTHSSNSKVDLSPFSNLEQLDINPSLCSNITEVLKQNNISSLTLSWNLSILALISYFSNLWYLSVNIMDEPVLTEVMKLPLLNTLHVNMMIMPYGCFTRLVNRQSSIKSFSISTFRRTKFQRIHILPPLEYLNITEAIMGNFNAEIQWILFVISTLNIEEVNYSGLRIITQQILSNILRQKLIVEPIDYIIHHLKNTLNEILKDGRYLEINDIEKKIIEVRFETVFQYNNTRMHPSIKHLIEQMRK